LNKCDSLRTTSYGNGSIAFIFAALNDKEQMHKYLHKALDKRKALHFFIDFYPEFISCENDGEYQRLKSETWMPRK